MVDQVGVLLSRLEANHKVLCLRQTIVVAGIDRVDFMTFDGCNAPGESQAQATNRLQGQLRDQLQCCIELETLIREGHRRPLLACRRLLLDTDHLSNPVQPSMADLVNHMMRAAALLIQCMDKKAPLWSPELINGACLAQMLKVMELLKNTSYSQQELLDNLQLFFCYQLEVDM